MARRLALLALLACAVAAYRPPPSGDNSESVEPLSLWEEYDENLDSTPLTRMVPVKHKSKPSKIKPSTVKPYTVKPKPFTVKPNKVILKTTVPKLNVTKKDSDSDKTEKVIKTTINIASHTNFFVTDRAHMLLPFFKNQTDTKPSNGNFIKIEDQNLWVNDVLMTMKPTKKPVKSSQNTIKATTQRSRGTTKRQRPTTRRTIQKATKPSKRKPCKSTTEGWLSDYFRTNDVSTRPPPPPPKEVKTGSIVGFFSDFVSWLLGSRTWFGGGWFQDSMDVKSTTTPYTPLLANDNNWFHSVVASEEYDENNPYRQPSQPAKKKSLKKTYNGYQLIRAYPDLQWKVRSLLDLQEDAEGSGLTWWTQPSLNGTTDLLVPPDLLTDVKYHLKSSYIEFEVIIWDLQKAIMYENPKMSKKQRLELEQLRGHPMTWRRYHRYADILRYLEYLQHSYSDNVELIPLGRSSEGLPLVAVKVSNPSNESKSSQTSRAHSKKWKLRSHMKPAVWIEAGLHAREWIAPAVATWMLHSLIEGERGQGPDKELLNVADFYIMPVMNPDGYEHTHTHDRLWRKTRSRTGDDSDDYYTSWFPWNWGQTECVGVDADRNWDFHWGEKDSSNDRCSENYAGPYPFSEPETRAVSDFIMENRSQMKLYISLHAYSQAWLLPSSHVITPYADDVIMMDMGKLAVDALADIYGTKYQVGTADSLRQPASGMSHDWAKARARIKYAYHVDLRDSYGPYGFLLPGSQIVPTALETWQAIKAIVDNLSP